MKARQSVGTSIALHYSSVDIYGKMQRAVAALPDKAALLRPYGSAHIAAADPTWKFNVRDYMRTRREELRSPLGYITFVQFYAYIDAIQRAGARPMDAKTARFLQPQHVGIYHQDHLQAAVGFPGGAGVDPEAVLLAAAIAWNLDYTLATVNGDTFPPSVEFGLDLRAVPGLRAGRAPIDGPVNIFLDGIPLLTWVAGSCRVWCSLQAPFKGGRAFRKWVVRESAWQSSVRQVPHATAATHEGSDQAALLGRRDAESEADECAAIRDGNMPYGVLRGSVNRWLERAEGRLHGDMRKAARERDLSFLRALLDDFGALTVADLAPAHRRNFFNHMVAQCFPRVAIGCVK